MLRTLFTSQICKARPLSLALASSKAVANTSPLQRFAAIRFQSSSSASASTSSSNGDASHSAVRDSSYPFPLYYHLLPVDSTTAGDTKAPAATSDGHVHYALSFLPTFPKNNQQVIGYIGLNLDDNKELKVLPNRFTENPAFKDVLHTVIQQNLNKDPMVEMVLQQQLEGWTHIADYRNPAPYGRIPLPEDIFGSVQIIDGVIQSSTYQRMPAHRIASINGLFQLSEYLQEKLVDHIKRL
ncbi:hypothetical protein BGZ99_001156 [Dissophora globulifera]|uniref:Uncharacterized protein n=1 Tax=Dissophora globulifera TaxID=979702 RepID=A0A9P6RRQ7_9FUNG|nr:hypothetical protein BGZ99_001156 [Dissophora globulifera]